MLFGGCFLRFFIFNKCSSLGSDEEGTVGPFLRSWGFKMRNLIALDPKCDNFSATKGLF